MDIKNPVESPVTFNLHRLEYLVAFAVTIGFILWHFTDINWFAAIGLFLYIDLLGYIPGAIAYRRSPDGRIHKAYYVLYNSMHSLLSVAAVGLLWMWLIGPEWALLALPFHVFGDRGVFGNFLKPFGLPFEPESTPLVDQVTAMLGRRAATDGPVPLPYEEAATTKTGATLGATAAAPAVGANR
ncbi:hypothetical protein ACFY7H_29235 [Streptomyces sp. NPDC012794]|uniref:hypothetical protein n=1 Tax=Streptomyces sp. NPDC012794 TaxID=3364850 RepID=UPI0036C72645